MATKSDLAILGDTREPIVVTCEQCNAHLGFFVGGSTWDEMPSGTLLCLGCLHRLDEWSRRAAS
jgi:hypothetical protein